MLKIEGESIYLSNLTDEHATSKYVGWLNDNEINQYLETRHKMQNLDSVRDFIRLCNDSKLTYLLGIFSKNGKHLGNIKSGPIDEINKKTDIGILIGEKSFWGKGIATEAIKLLTKYLFENTDLNRIEAGCYEKNLGSKKAFENNGYKEEGFRRESYVSNGGFQGCWYLGITRSEYYDIKS